MDSSRPTRQFSFDLLWNNRPIQLELSTTGQLWMRNKAALSEPDQAFFNRVLDLAEQLKGSPYRQSLLQQLQRDAVTKQISTQKLPSLIPQGEDPFDRYFVSIDRQLPRIFAKLIPSINIFMLFLAALFLIPLVTQNKITTFSAVALSFLALSAQLFSSLLEKKLGPTKNRLIQDVFSGVTLSISSFSSLRVLASIFLNRVLELGNKDQDLEAHFIGGSVVIAVASIGAMAACFFPSVTVMGPRIQANAIELERKCRKTKLKNGSTFRNKTVAAFKENEGSSLAQRFFCASRKKKISEYQRDERMINPPSAFMVAGRLGGAFVRSTQLSIAAGLNAGIFEAILLPLVMLGLLHAFVNREISINAGRKSLCKIPAMSAKAPTLAKGIKWTSEICAVMYNSMINPAIAFFFVLQKILKLYQADFRSSGNFRGLDGGLLAGIAFLNALSLILDLSSRRLGIDRFEGWSPSRLNYILEESQNASIRQDLENYLQLLIKSAQSKITLPKEEAIGKATEDSLGVLRR